MFETHYAGDLSCINHPLVESGVILVGGSPPTAQRDPFVLSPKHDCYDRSQNDPPYENFFGNYNQTRRTTVTGRHIISSLN